MFSKKTIRDIEVKGKRVLVRVDFNVPLKDNAVGDDTRIRSALPTIQYLLDHGAAVILCSHLGRPKGGPDPKYTLKPVAAHLAGLLGKPVAFAEDCIGAPAETAVSALKPGEVLVLENTRFHPEEEANDLEMARQLASLADLFVNDAFGTAHRAHASTEGVTITCRVWLVSCWKGKSSTWDRQWRNPLIRLWRSWVAQKSRTRLV